MDMDDMRAVASTGQQAQVSAGLRAGVPPGFAAHCDGVYLLPDAGAEESEPIWLCTPVSVRSRFRNPSGGGWGRIVEVTDPDGRVHEVTLLDSDLEGRPAKVRALVTDHGLRLRHGSKARQAFVRLVRDWIPPATLMSTARVGWIDDTCTAFVLGDGRVLGDGNVVYLGCQRSDPVDRCLSAGALDDWRRDVSGLCVGNPLLVLAVSLAFAGPLLELLNEEGGGLHFRGASSRGKTTLQRAAVSVWGDPGKLRSWRTTANGIEDVARSCNGMLLALDEIAEIGGKELENAAYMLANGVGKVRADAFGRSAPPARWRVAILSTGEISLAEKIEEGGARYMAGQAVRILDIEADTRRHGAFDALHGCCDGAAFAELLKRRTALSHGTAGLAFVDRLLAHKDEVARAALAMIGRGVDRTQREFGLHSEGQALRAARRLAVIAAAGELATHFGLTGWSRGEALTAAEVAMESWLGAGRRGPSFGVEAAIERTRSFLQANSAGFIGLGETAHPTSGQTLGWWDGDHFLFRAETWFGLHGQGAQQAARDLLSADLLVPGEGKNLGRRTTRAIKGRPRVYAVRSAILNSFGEGTTCQAAL